MYENEMSFKIENQGLDKLSSLNLDAVNNVPIDLQEQIEGIDKELSGKNKEVEAIYERVFQERIDQEKFKEIEEMFNLSEHGVEGEILIYSENALDGSNEDKEIVDVVAVLRNGNEYKGRVNLRFYQEDGELIMYVGTRELVDKKSGVSLDLQCKLEEFCKKKSIQEIHNYATSGEGLSGAYVWAKYGYEFKGGAQCQRLRETLERYLEKNNIQVDEENLSKLEKPYDFAVLTGTDTEGREVKIGKSFLLAEDEENTWAGVRRIGEDQPGTHIFVEYLKQRGRQDLVEKHYKES